MTNNSRKEVLLRVGIFHQYEAKIDELKYSKNDEKKGTNHKVPFSTL